MKKVAIAVVTGLAGFQPAAADDTANVVHALTEAFNRHDVSAMRALWHEYIAWLEIDGETISVVMRGASAFETAMMDYFKSYPDVRSTLAGAAESGAFLSGVETVNWNSGAVSRRQSGPVVYEVREGKVFRVWYYPATKGR
ncbi:MAG: nuclear transport factor 2 family protein [Parvularculaceae bacterium]